MNNEKIALKWKSELEATLLEKEMLLSKQSSTNSEDFEKKIAKYLEDKQVLMTENERLKLEKS